MSIATPRISVIIPTRNRAELLRRSVRSVLAQTCRDFELIVVDDASADHTPQVLEQFHDPRLRVLRRDERDSSAAAARNCGIRASRAPLIAFQDDDDFWLVTKLERQLRALDAAPAATGLCLAGYIRLDPDGPVYVGGQHMMRAFDYSRGFYAGDRKADYSLIATPGWLVRRDALEQAGLLFDERLRSLDDWELGLRLSQVCAFVHVDEPLFVQDRTQGSGMVYNEPARASDTRVIVEKHGRKWQGRRRVQARHSYIIGKITPGMPIAERRAWLWRSIRGNPLFFKSWAALALSLLGEGALNAVTRQVRTARARLKSAAPPHA